MVRVGISLPDLCTIHDDSKVGNIVFKIWQSVKKCILRPAMPVGTRYDLCIVRFQNNVLLLLVASGKVH